MKKKLPFEEAIESKLQQVPTPDEESSWQAMNNLLDKNDKRGIFFPRKRYFILLLILCLLLPGAWLLLHNSKTANRVVDDKNVATAVSQNSKNTIASTDNIKTGSNNNLDDNKAGKVDNAFSNTSTKENAVEPNTDDKIKPVAADKNNVTISATDTKNVSTNTVSENNNYKNKLVTKNKTIASKKTIVNTAGNNEEVSKNNYKNKPARNDQGKKVAKNKKEKATPDVYNSKKNRFNTKTKTRMNATGSAETDKANDAGEIATEPTAKNIPEDKISKIADDTVVADPIVITGKTITTPIASPIKNDSIKDKIVVAKASSQKKKKANRFTWSAGIGLQQQIPLGKQKLIAYGFNGHNNIINDYVPSVYLQFENPGKWFAQLEYDYASPRLVGGFAYSRKTTMNNFSGELSTTSLQLKKTFYHETSLSFNYYIMPHWSVGVGGMWRQLYKAISEQRSSLKNIQDQSEEITSKIIPAGYKDSFLYRSNTNLMLQTNYEWRRMSFGLRWSADLQPYIKYTMPSGEIADRKSWALEFLLRIRLLRSGK